jgi:hypothetical protein
MSTKTCKDCNRDETEVEFNPRQPRCKTCQKTNNAKRHQDYKNAHLQGALSIQEMLEVDKLWRVTNG